MTKWTVVAHVGVFWPGYDYVIGRWPFTWLGHLQAFFYLKRHGYRYCTILKTATIRRETSRFIEGDDA